MYIFFVCSTFIYHCLSNNKHKLNFFLPKHIMAAVIACLPQMFIVSSHLTTSVTLIFPFFEIGLMLFGLRVLCEEQHNLY